MLPTTRSKLELRRLIMTDKVGDVQLKFYVIPVECTLLMGHILKRWIIADIKNRTTFILTLSIFFSNLYILYSADSYANTL